MHARTHVWGAPARLFRRLFGGVLLGGVLFSGVLLGGCAADRDSANRAATPPDSLRAAVESRIAALNDMREALAQTIETPDVDRSTFERVCRPVGMRAQQMARRQNWTVQQLAVRYRTPPPHEPDAEADSVHAVFARNPKTMDTWIRTVRGGASGWRYLRRITVQPSCLACHGAEAARPAFVRKGYPQDRAYGFEAGDLRGVYAVFVADSLLTRRPVAR